ncbi:antitoxin [Rhodoplanes elegans]|uniref:Antitoxin n=1 Tax=Rhodoplanes elegans TaxID=29408 RepID=A0A327KFR9_9BRAD|nr:antitoxin [Rhodoplanes elegans]RAI36971.1 antitoxin [Rhodoplanes elegans]
MAKQGPVTKRRSAAAGVKGTAARSGTAAKSGTESKAAINLRIEPDTRRMIDSAAAALGKTRTEFMIETARARAVDVLLDQRLYVLAPDRYAAFVRALDDPPPPGPKLRALLGRKPAWDT